MPVREREEMKCDGGLLLLFHRVSALSIRFAKLSKAHWQCLLLSLADLAD